MRRCTCLLLVLALSLPVAACSGERSLEERTAEGPILQVVDPALPVPRFFVVEGAAGWADAADEVDADSFALRCWQERNGVPGLQLDGDRPDVLQSATSGTSERATAVGVPVGPALRTGLTIRAEGGTSVERVLAGGPITAWPPKEAGAWRKLARLDDLGVALEMFGVREDGTTAFRLRATGRDAEAAPLRLTVLIAGARTPKDKGPNDQYATTWFADHGQDGVRMTLHVERGGEGGAVDGLRLQVEPASGS
ncbi:MAG: hypothetical protein AAGI22_07965 [Planctomycetota bacterium]